MDLQKGRMCEGITFREFSLWQARKKRRTLRHTELSPNADQRTDEEDVGTMALSKEARQFLTENGLEGFMCIADAPPHEEPEHAATSIDLSEITEGAIQAMAGLQVGGLQSVECPSNEILLEYFGVYSLSSKAYRTQGGPDLLFREVARVLLEYGFVHPRPPAMPNRRRRTTKRSNGRASRTRRHIETATDRTTTRDKGAYKYIELNEVTTRRPVSDKAPLPTHTHTENEMESLPEALRRSAEQSQPLENLHNRQYRKMEEKSSVPV